MYQDSEDIFDDIPNNKEIFLKWVDDNFFIGEKHELESKYLQAKISEIVIQATSQMEPVYWRTHQVSPYGEHEFEGVQATVLSWRGKTHVIIPHDFNGSTETPFGMDFFIFFRHEYLP